MNYSLINRGNIISRCKISSQSEESLLLSVGLCNALISASN